MKILNMIVLIGPAIGLSDACGSVRAPSCIDLGGPLTFVLADVPEIVEFSISQIICQPGQIVLDDLQYLRRQIQTSLTEHGNRATIARYCVLVCRASAGE